MGSNNKSLDFISAGIRNMNTAYAPYGFQRGKVTPTHLSNYITPIQFERLAHDVRMWREAIREIELAINPMRVRAMRMYIDTVENPYIKALLNRWRDLTNLRDVVVYQKKGGKKIESVDLTQQLDEQEWFKDYIDIVNEAQLWGYSLVELGDMINDGFPNITFTRRENIRPDGYTKDQTPILTSLVYAIDGIHIEQDNEIVRLANHWVPTKSNRGVSNCGYGLLYNIALLEIHIRHIMEWNADYVEMYGQPIKKGFTNKTGDDRNDFEEFLASAGSNAYVLLDKGTNDDIEYVWAQAAGTAWKCYPDLEKRLKGCASQLVLGHEDSMSSTPGKLGGQQAANKDGFNESLIEQAMNDKQTVAGKFVCSYANLHGFPKFRRLGDLYGSKLLKNLVPEGYTFGLKNNKEEEEIRRRINSQRQVVSMYVKTMNDAGWDIDQNQLQDWFGMTLTPSIPSKELIEKRKTEVVKDNPSDTGKDTGTTDANKIEQNKIIQ